MSGWVPNTLTGSFYLAEQHMPDEASELMAQVKERIARMLADKLVDALAESPGGAIYSPITYTIREATPYGDYRVVGTIQTYRLPDPESNEYQLIGGPMDGAIIRVGTPAPEHYPVPLLHPYAFSASPEPSFVIYDRVPGVSAYRWSGR